MHPLIQTAIASQHIREMQAEAARTARARTARQGKSPRLGWLFDLADRRAADRRAAARAAQDGLDFCCPENLLTGQCAVHTGAHRAAAGSGRPS